MLNSMGKSKIVCLFIQFLTAFVIPMEFFKGIISSGVLFLFWMLAAIVEYAALFIAAYGQVIPVSFELQIDRLMKKST